MCNALLASQCAALLSLCTPKTMPRQFCSLHCRSGNLFRGISQPSCAIAIQPHTTGKPVQKRQRGPCKRGTLRIASCAAMSDKCPASPHSTNRRQPPVFRVRYSTVSNTKAASAMSETAEPADHSAFVDLANELADTAAAVTTPYFR